MLQASKRAVRFVCALLPDHEASCGGDGLFRAAAAGRLTTLPGAEVAALISAGVLAGTTALCRPRPEARSWLRRQLAEVDAEGAQHRDEVRSADGRRINLAESPLARLATRNAGDAEAFLAPHQVEAGERVRRLAERAKLRSRVTMSYDPTHTASSRGGAHELSDMAADARKSLAAIANVLPPDCADVVFDVCALEKGLQVIESERGWPRRSAKLVLRIGLDQLARYFRLDPTATGTGTARRHWMASGSRPAMFPDG